MMSGHSKWSTIKRQKALTDKARGAHFTKLANAISLAVGEGGGGDPESNFKLRLAIEKARAANMPKDNIERAINRVLNKAEGVAFSEIVYEGFAPGGIAILVEGVTDNRQRTSQAVKNAFHINGAHLGTQGSVSYLFKHSSEIHIEKSASIDKVLEMVLEINGIDVEEVSDRFIVISKPELLSNTKVYFEKKGLTVIESELTFRPIASIILADSQAEKKIMELLTTLEDLDDIHRVYTNAQFSDNTNK